MIIAIGLYQGFTALDAIGPYEILTYLPGAEMVLCAESAGVFDDHNNLVHLRVDRTFAEVPRPDVLLVPGGPVAGRYAADGHPVVDWIREAHPHTTWTTSVCTGALLLGAAGLLDGLPATTHWSAYDASPGPKSRRSPAHSTVMATTPSPASRRGVNAASRGDPGANRALTGAVPAM